MKIAVSDLPSKMLNTLQGRFFVGGGERIVDVLLWADMAGINRASIPAAPNANSSVIAS